MLDLCGASRGGFGPGGRVRAYLAPEVLVGRHPSPRLARGRGAERSLKTRAEKDALDAKRRRWLGFHDQQTGGIMGLMPLVKGLPVRLTHPENRKLKLFKNSKCTIHSWTLNKQEAFVIPHCLVDIFSLLWL